MLLQTCLSPTMIDSDGVEGRIGRVQLERARSDYLRHAAHSDLQPFPFKISAFDSE